MDHEMNHGSSSRGASLFRSRSGIVLIGFLLVAGYFLVTEHRAHLALAIPYLPFLLLAACPLMHLFHHGHQRHSGDNAKTNHDDHG